MLEGCELDERCRRAAEIVRSAEAILIGAGAGMGVDSGLPDFRGPEGFWKAYPPFRGRAFSDVSNPQTFAADPVLAWGFFGHRLNLYRATWPHAGFEILRRWGERAPLGAFVFTSNVDGQFQKAGFDPKRVVECHGSIHHLQCARPCGRDIWSADRLRVEVDEREIRARGALPDCPRCGRLARPNILMFGDGSWIADRTEEQCERYVEWLKRIDGRRVVAVELGAGLAIPTVRRQCEAAAGTVVRINPRDADTSDRGLSLPLGALDALTRIDRGM